MGSHHCNTGTLQKARASKVSEILQNHTLSLQILTKKDLISRGLPGPLNTEGVRFTAGSTFLSPYLNQEKMPGAILNDKPLGNIFVNGDLL